MNCREFDEIADSYLSGELLVETNHEVIRHLESCASCRQELSEKRKFRTRIRTIARSVATPIPGLSARVRSRVYAQDKRPLSRFLVPSLTFAAIIVAIALGTAVYFDQDKQEFSNVNTATKPFSESDLIAGFKDAVGNHEDCGLKFGSRPAKKIAEEYAALMSEHEDLEFIEEHDCIFKGKRYAHTIFRSGSKLISVLKVKVDLPRGSGTIVSSPVGGYQVAEFESNNHAIFVISNLTETENLQFARKISSGIS